ncbi:uncharacterized protein N7484_009237 [Penicillium longicatenatum]|uniref:uncharacterized protein n=1 Tax=Penicillium longicatenatum TaxID=1561947 RepID=UPI0025470807|nr:uncharacterized protein N7484_009237 [Penicillium longicatenatum]KAJ5635924.1 hypothetical protein N7484_009237 [Penicillium longicatenatum]
MFRLIVTISAVLTGSSAVYFYICHQKLSSRIQHTSQSGLSSAKSKPQSIESIPEGVLTEKFFALHDHASKSVLRGSLPNIPIELLFTKLVRRNMTTFTHFPQALMIRLVCDTKEQKRSFKASHISSLDFNEGDLVCGVYRVIARSSNKVEFEIKMVNMDFCCARLALSFHEKGDEVVFCSETMMWRPADECQNMPLERPLIRWMHETAAWWLIDSGVKYLTELES